MVIFEHLSHYRFSIHEVWAIKDDDFFTDEEYEELLTSSIGRQHFVEQPTTVKINPLGDVIEGKDDYFAHPVSKNEIIRKRLVWWLEPRV